MNNIEDDLRINICFILSSVSQETVNVIIDALKYAGLELLSDLKFMQEDDLLLVLKPVQRRKLVKAWNEQNVTTVNNCKLLDNLRWKQKRCLRLLQIYAKYKNVFLCSGVKEEKVWEKITNEIQEKLLLNCDQFQCRDKIEELKCFYEKNKNKDVTSQSVADLIGESRKAFEITDNSVNLGSIFGLLKTSICSILNSVSEETINDVFNAVKYAGLESLSDVQFIEESDLILVLNPIQRRKLVKAWARSVTALPKFSSTESSSKFKWKWDRRLALLRLYAMHKTDLTSPNINKQSVWENIAKKISKDCSIKCDITQCQNQLHYMKYEYERGKGKTLNITNQKQAIFLDEAKNAFETSENPDNFIVQWSNLNLKKWVVNESSRLTLLRVYAKYKTEFLSSDIEEEKVWQKIAREVTKKCSLYFGELRCRYEINRLKKRYENCNKENINNIKIPHFFKEAKEAFESTKEYSDVTEE